MSGIYGYLCELCCHPSSSHTWKPEDGGTLKEGPYICADCGCSIPQDGPCVGLSSREWRAWEAKQATP